MEEIVKHRNIAFRIGDKLPKWARVIYYILLFITLIWAVYQLIKWTLIGFQKLGYFFFAQNHYWVFITCVFITLIGSLLLAQFAWGQDPLGKFFNSICEMFNKLRVNTGNWLGGA